MIKDVNDATNVPTEELTSEELTSEEFTEIQEAHNEESLWYLFLNYGDPLQGKNKKYAELFNKVSSALEEYTDFMEKEANKFGEGFSL